MTSAEQLDRRILIIETSSYFARLFGTWAMEVGFNEVSHAPDTTRAWSLLLIERFDLVLCDRDIGPDDGLEMTRLLRLTRDNQNRFVPIIFMASASTQRLVETARDCGINEFLAKPVSKKAFAERLKAITDRPRNFIKAGVFFGPDRRRRINEFDGEDRRRLRPEKVTITAKKEDERLI